MAETTYNLERDLAEARAMAQSLDDYVRSADLYGSVSGTFSTDPNLPSLTIGALMMRLRRLRAQEGRMTDAQKAILTEIETENERVRRAWAEHYTRKAQREATSRLQSVDAFVAECEDDPEGCAEAYPSAARDRTLAQEAIRALVEQHLPDADLGDIARREDSQLQRFTEAGPFLWAKDLESIYPKDNYWWLYSQPRTDR